MNQATITFASAAPVVIVGERLAELESIIYRGFQTYVKGGAAPRGNSLASTISRKGFTMFEEFASVQWC
jgi:hypothetical protein